jgi:hypothetical protein
MFSKFPGFGESIPPVKGKVNTKGNVKTEKVMNEKGAQRRYAAKMTLGDSQSEVFTCRWDPTDKYLACGVGDGAVRIYNS